MKKILFFTLLVVYPVFSQISVTVYQGPNFPYNFYGVENPYYLIQYWSQGKTLGISMDFLISKQLAISPSFELTDYRYQSGYLVGPAASSGIFSKKEEDSYFYRFFIEGKLIPQGNRSFTMIISSGFGFVVEDIGNIFRPPYQSLITYPENNYWIHTFGIGFRLFLFRNLGLDLTGRLFSNYEDRFHVSLNGGIVYTIKNK